MKLFLLLFLALITSGIVSAQNIVIDGNDTARVGKLMRAAKKSAYVSDAGALEKTAEELEKAGKETDSKVALINASRYRGFSALLASNYTDALKFAFQALDQSKEWHIDRYLTDIYSLIGTAYKENLDYPKAMDAIEKSVKAAEGLKDTAIVIGAYLDKAMFMHGYSNNLKDTVMNRRALELHLKGLVLAKSNPKFERNSIGYYSNISSHYLRHGNYAKAIEIATEGTVLAKKYDRFKSLTYQYNWLGLAYFKLGQREKGIAIIEQALAICKQKGYVFREMEVYQELENCYVDLGDYKKAWQANNRWVELHDSLNIINNVQKLDELNVKYQTSEKNARIALLNHSAKSKNTLFIIGGVITLLLAVFTIVLSRQKQRLNNTNQSLVGSNQTIKEQAAKLELLLKELHHRVKNNLQIVSSLLKLQSNRLTDEDAVHALRDSQQRIEAMSLIHRTLYQQENASLVNMRQFINDLVASVMRTFGLMDAGVDFQLETNTEDMDIDQALPLGLIINELVINSFKHAYPTALKPFELHINLNCKDGCRLLVTDNGPGIPSGVWSNPKGSFGVKLIKLLTQQLGGHSTMSVMNGTRFELNIPPSL